MKRIGKKGASMVVAAALMAMLTVGLMFASAQPPQPFTIKGNVTYMNNGTRVPAGWTVNISDLTKGWSISTTTEDTPPVVDYNYKVDISASNVSAGDILEVYAEDPTGTFYGSTTHTITESEISAGRVKVDVSVKEKDTIAPTTNVTAPPTLWPGKPSETTIPSGTILPWTNETVKLWFFRTDNGGSGVAYTNLSLAPTSVTEKLNVTISNGVQIDMMLEKGKNLTIPYAGADTFNVTISEECNATIVYYSVDNAWNSETPKTVTVRIKYPATGNVSINEIMYAPDDEWGGWYNEWIELHNKDDKAVNLTGWEIDGKEIPDGTIIKPKGYLIIAKNDTSFAEIYPGAVCSVVKVSIELNNEGEELFLNDSAGKVVDSVNYTPYADGNLGKKNGKTLERNETAWEESIRNGGTPCQRNSVLPPTPFVIDGYVFYENNTPCNNPTVKITNDKIGEWFAKNLTDSNYYMLTLKSTADVMAGDTLRIDASSPDGTQINVTTFVVTQADIDKGGVRINITLERPKLKEIKVTPQSAVVTVNTTKEFIATAYDQYENPLEGVFIYWTSTNKTVGNVSPALSITGPDGNATATFTARAPGNTTVVAGNKIDARPIIGWANVTVILPTAPGPEIVSYYPTEETVTNKEGESREFKVKANQTVNVSWYINGSLVHENISVPAFVNATYTNTSAVPGLWNVSVMVENENGTDMHSWIWNVRSPYAVELSVEPPVYVCVRPNENATFRIIVKNNGTKPDKFNLTVEAPGNVNAILSKKETSELDPGETENITLNVSSSQIGEYIVSVTATSQNDPSVSDTVITTTNVTEVPHRIVELVYNENNKGYNYIAWTGDYTINASDLVSMIRKGAGERVFPDDAFIAYFNTTSGDWEIFFGDGTGTTNFKLKQYEVVCVRVADEGKFYMPVP
ncbi:MAG: lamin tail domain-containing protein [Candidatus Methanospirare jalkutatii]|nr:lamin tail domain-containing protein [Candidatus Methanospirare jalkutatii]